MVKKQRTKARPSEHPLEDHPAYTKAIGMVSLETVALETRLATLLARLLDIPVRIGQAIYLTPKAEQVRLEILKNAAHARLAVSPSKRMSALGRQQIKALEDVVRIADRAQALIGKRHRVVHDEWNYSDKEREVTRKRIDGQPGRERTPVAQQELDTLIQQLRVLIDDVHDLSISFREHPPFSADRKSDSTKSV